MNRRLLLLAFLLLAAALAPGQDAYYTRLQQFTEKDGYKVFATAGYITQDKDGLLWIGSDNGLYAFDGVHFKAYRQKRNDSTGLPSNWITFNYQDRQGVYWVGISSHGLYWFHPQTGRFEKVRYQKQTSFDVNKERCNIPYETKSGGLWFPLPGFGLARWDRPSQRMVPYPIRAKSGGDNDPACWVTRITEDPNDGSLWLATNAGLIHFSPADGSFRLYTDEASPPAPASMCLYWDNDKTLWVGTWSKGIKKFDRQAKTFTSYTWSPQFAGTLNICTGIGKFDEQRLLVASLDQGLFVFDKQTSCFQKLKSTSDVQTDLPAESFYQNAQGVMWAGSRLSLTRIHPAENRLAFTSLASLQKTKPDAALFWAFLKTDSLLFTGMYYHGDLVAVNEKTQQVSVFPHKGIAGIRHLSRDEAGRIWVATSPGVYVFDPLRKRFAKPFGGALDSLRVNDMLHDAGGAKWLATNSGLCRYDSLRQQLVWTTERKASPNDLSAIVYQLYKDATGNLWFANQQKGLGCLRPGGSIACFNAAGVQPQGQKCVSISPTDDGRILFAIEKLGLCELSRPFTPQQKIKVYKTANGLPADDVSQIVKDSGGRQWLTTINGIALLDERTMAVRNFTKQEGLYDNFMAGGIYRAGDGRFYLGFANTYQSFLPADLLREEKEAGRIYLSSLKINGEDWPGAVHSGKAVELNSEQTNFAFEAAFLTLAQTPGYAISYKLEGIDKDWVQADEKMSGQYNALPAGRYRLLIKAHGGNGKQKGDEFALNVRIKPPWYKSTPFYIALSLLLLAIVAAFHFYRVLEIHKRARLRQAVNKRIANTEMRALRAQMNPHFIFNCLGSINRYIVKSDHKTASNYLTKFSKLIRLILDNSASDTIGLDKELQTLQLYLDMEALRFDHAFDYEIDASEVAQPEAVIIPSMLLQPYVENAIWHGLLNKEDGQGKLWIRMTQTSPRLLRVEIIDNGVGRAKAKELAITNGVHKSYGMQISKERIQLLAELHGMKAGVRIEDLAEDEKATGTKVVVEIPVRAPS